MIYKRYVHSWSERIDWIGLQQKNFPHSCHTCNSYSEQVSKLKIRNLMIHSIDLINNIVSKWNARKTRLFQFFSIECECMIQWKHIPFIETELLRLNLLRYSMQMNFSQNLAIADENNYYHWCGQIMLEMKLNSMWYSATTSYFHPNCGLHWCNRA